MFKIAQSAVNELGGARRRAGSEIVHFGQRNRITTTDGIPCDAASIDAATDDEDVEYVLRRHCFPPTFRIAQF